VILSNLDDYLKKFDEMSLTEGDVERR